MPENIMTTLLVQLPSIIASVTALVIALRSKKESSAASVRSLEASGIASEARKATILSEKRSNPLQ